MTRLELEQEPCEDCISRKAVRDAIFAECSSINLDIDFAKVLLLQRAIKDLPSVVTPQKPKTGHWIKTSDYLTAAYGSIYYVKCSCCGEDSLEEGDYCPNCGAKMVWPQKSEDEK